MAAPEDTPWNRFVTFAVTAALFGSFGLATWLLYLVAGDNAWTELEAPGAKARAGRIAAFRESVPAPVSVDPGTAVAVLAGSKATKSGILVPGSPTALEQAQNPPEQKHDPAESELLDL